MPRVVALVNALGMVDLADHAVLHPFGVLLKVAPGALLKADLHPPFVGADRQPHFLPHFDAVRQRFLAVGVLARLAGFDQYGPMPMIRRGDQDGVYVLAVQHTPVVGHRVGVALGLLAQLWPPPFLRAAWLHVAPPPPPP